EHPVTTGRRARMSPKRGTRAVEILRPRPGAWLSWSRPTTMRLSRLELRPLLLLVPLVAAALGVACGSSSPSGAGGDQTCSPSVPCGSAQGRSTAACTNAGHSSCSFHTSDGTVFSCASCSDCTAATQQAAAWCDGSPTSDGGSGSGSGSG